MGGFLPRSESIGVCGDGTYTQHHSVGTWGGFKLRACPQQLDRATGVYIIPAYTQQLTAAFSATILAQPRMGSLDQVDSMALYMLHIAGAGEGSFASTVYLFRKTELNF